MPEAAPINVLNRNLYYNKRNPSLPKLPDGAEYLGRPRALSNPYKMSIYGRDRSIKLYKWELFQHITWGGMPDWDVLKDEGKIPPEVLTLGGFQMKGTTYDRFIEQVQKHQLGETLNLVCSCAPQPCHLDALKGAVLWFSNQHTLAPKLADLIEPTQDAQPDSSPNSSQPKTQTVPATKTTTPLLEGTGDEATTSEVNQGEVLQDPGTDLSVSGIVEHCKTLGPRGWAIHLPNIQAEKIEAESSPLLAALHLISAYWVVNPSFNSQKDQATYRRLRPIAPKLIFSMAAQLYLSKGGLMPTLREAIDSWVRNYPPHPLDCTLEGMRIEIREGKSYWV